MKNYKSAILISLGTSLVGFAIIYTVYGYLQRRQNDKKAIKKCYSPTCNMSPKNYSCYSPTCRIKGIEKK